jgi:hypothetical protein
MSGQIPHGAAASREHIPPVSGGDRPLWSVMIPTHNCAAYLRETLQSVLAQDPGPARMQIEVVDDHSTADDPEAVVRELGGGRVAFYRQPRNLGHVGNFNSCLQRSRGLLVHLLHGDDRVREGFYRALEQPFLRHPEIGAAFCRAIVIDEDGHWNHLKPLAQEHSGRLENALEIIAAEFPLEPPAMVVRRSVYERLGGFDSRFRFCGEDLEMWVRIAAAYPMAYEIEPLALYRLQQCSLSGISKRSGRNIRDSLLAIRTFEAYLPPERASRLVRHTREKFAFWAVDTARQMMARGDPEAARAQLREALRCSRSPRVLDRIARLVAWRLRQRVRQRAGVRPW